MADSTVSVAFTQQYSALVYKLSQQKGSKMQSRVRVETITNAKDAFFERLGNATVQKITTRHGDTPLNEQPHSRRKVTPADYNTATLLDTADRLKMLIDPRSPYAQQQAAALGRKKDDIIIEAALGDAGTGVDGLTLVSFKDESISINGDGTPTTLGTLATAAGSGSVADISLEKILLMMQIFNEEDVDPDIPKHWMVHPKSIEDMLNLEKLTSADYVTVKNLQQGGIETFHGFSWFWSNRITKDAASETAYRSIAWAQDGLILAQAQEVMSRITERDDKNYSIQVYSEMSMGAVRMEGAKVHECLNKVA